MAKQIWYATEGDFGKVLCLVLSDANGPISLDGATCTFSMGTECDAVIDAAEAEPDADQMANPGRICYRFVEGELVAGHFNGTFTATWPNPVPMQFTGPTDPVLIIVGRKPAVAPPGP